MGNTCMYQVLRDNGDRISQIGLFSFKVKATGDIYESGVSMATGSTMRTYINKWPHIKWLLTVSNDGTNSIFAALRDNADGAQDTFLSDLVRIMEEYPFCDGIDMPIGETESLRWALFSFHRKGRVSVKLFESDYNIHIPLEVLEEFRMRQCMDADNLHRRLKKIIGQVQTIDRMVDEDVPCEDILAQINAAKSALHGCGKVVLEGHIQHCVRDGIEHGDADKTIADFTKAVERFANMG